MKQTSEKGFHAVAVIIILAVVGAIGFAGWRIYKMKSQNEATFQVSNTQTGEREKVSWSRSGDWWRVSGTPPACPEPLLKLPVDIGQATAILYPGQTRGGDFKAHGGFRFNNQKDNKVTVSAPLDAQLVSGSRYIEMGEVQYMFEFIAPCGYIYRFDHLLVLDPKLQAAADKLPQPKENDSKTTNVGDSIAFKTGETLATQIGMNENGLNVFVDFGVYDLRNKNQAAQDSNWASAHYTLQHYGVCWFDLLSSDDEAKVRALPAGDGQSGKTSDYCKAE